MLRALVIGHMPHERLAGFRAPIEAAGYTIEEVDAAVLDPAATAGSDLVVLMGGPMGVYERDAYPWIAPEVDAIARRLAADRPTLGICLGAQLIAAALGAQVRPGPVAEVGFAPVILSAAGAASPVRHLARVPLLHWHGDTFDLPAGAERLASTAVYPEQGFRRGRRLLALQFHPEMGGDGDGFDDWLARAGDYPRQAGTSRAALAGERASSGRSAEAAGRRMLAEWLEALDAPA